MTILAYYTSHEILNTSSQDRSQQLPLPINHVFHAYTSSVKNIENSANFIIRHLISSYIKTPIIKVKPEITENNENKDKIKKEEIKIEYEYVLKEQLHDNEKLCIELANQAIDLMNNKKYELIQSKQLKLEQGIKPRQSTRKQPKKYKYDENGNIKPPAVYYLKPFEQVIDKTTFYQHIDTSLIQNILKLKEILDPQYKDFTSVNSHISQAAVDNVINNYNNFYKAIKAYYKNPVLFTGKPQLPHYHGKNNRCVFTLGKDRFKTKDNIAARVITPENINDFTSIRDKFNINQLFIDATKTIPVSKEDINAYNQFNLMPFINHKLNSVLDNEKQLLAQLKIIYNNKFHQSKNNKDNKFNSELNIEFVELKVIPLKHYNKVGNTVKLEIVLKHTLNLPQESMLSKLLLVNPKFLDITDKDKISFIQSFTKNYIKAESNNNNFNTTESSIKINELYTIANIDLGNRNLCSMTFNNGDEGIVVTGTNYFKTMNKIDSKIDKRKVEINTPVIKAIQSQYDKDKNTYNEVNLKYIEDIKLSQEYIDFNNKINKVELEDYLNKLLKEKLDKDNIKYPELSRQDKALVDEYEKNCREDNYLIKQQSYKNNYKDDFIHKLSTKIIHNCLIKGIDYLIIGKNDNWKQNINIGKINNRASYNFPHTELIEKLKYKALKFGIVVLITEESYSSKTSFMNNVELKIYNKESNKDKEIVKELELNSTESMPRDKQLLSDINNNEIEVNKVINDNKRKENPYGGYRRSRDKYVNKDNNSNKILDINKLKVVNADINGSFNMMRKIFPTIEYDNRYHNFNYKIASMHEHSKNFKFINKNKLLTKNMLSLSL